MDAEGGGVVATVSDSGLGFRDQTGKLFRVYWPFGFSSILDGTRIALVDSSGRTVAHEGDSVETAGGLISEDTWTVCMVISITAGSPTPS